MNNRPLYHLLKSLTSISLIAPTAVSIISEAVKKLIFILTEAILDKDISSSVPVNPNHPLFFATNLSSNVSVLSEMINLVNDFHPLQKRLALYTTFNNSFILKNYLIYKISKF